MLSELDNLSLHRLLDVNANRAMEAIRTAEEYVRFFLQDENLTMLCRGLRHRLCEAAMKLLAGQQRLEARDTTTDVGAGPALDSPGMRSGPRDVCEAAFQRLKESLRVLEEYGKLVRIDDARLFEKLRYEAYELEKTVLGTPGKPHPVEAVKSSGRIRNAGIGSNGVEAPGKVGTTEK